jgi:hypothetical protein
MSLRLDVFFLEDDINPGIQDVKLPAVLLKCISGYPGTYVFFLFKKLKRIGDVISG